MEFEDLRTILPRPPGSKPVISIGRCHMDDSYVCIYGQGNAGLDPEQIAFFI
jgi:hypothetical protein